MVLRVLMLMVCGLLPLLPQCVNAVPVSHLYQAEVPVQNMSVTARRQAVSRALAKVLIKVNGHSAVIEQPILKSPLNHATQFLEQFHYSHPTADTLALQAQFDPTAIDALLKQAKQFIWGKDRPLTLVWLASQTPDGREIMHNGQQDNTDLLQWCAHKRGIPIILPMMDLQDLNQITPQVIWQFNYPKIMAASKRYQTQAILVGHLAENKHDDWRATWQLYLPQRGPIAFQTSGLTRKQAIQYGFNQLADHLAKHFATTTVTNPVVILTVTGIKQFSSLERLKQYLGQLGMVSHVATDDINADKVQLRLTLSAPVHELQAALALSEQLRLAQPGGQHHLYYHWQAL